MLDFEGKWWRFPGAREQAIRDTFDMKPIEYMQRLNVLIDREEARAYAPTVVKRLRRQRGARGAARVRRARHG